MNTLKINILNSFISTIAEVLFEIIVYILKPIVQYAYHKYNTFKKYSNKKKKRIFKNILHRSIVCLSVIALGLLIAFGTNLFEQKANAQDNEILHKYYMSITIEPGESLWSIADDYYSLGYNSHSDYIDEVMHINHISNADDIRSGDTLVIPYYSDTILSE